jgi:ATP-dependent helicase Lhr and Lhr-like helicase
MEQKFEFVEECKPEEIEEILDPLVEEWFYKRFKEFSNAQKHGVLRINERKNILISAPTGSTKTLTAFLSILNYLVQLAKRNELENRVYAVYCSPLKALSNDIYVNLLKPLEEIREIAKEKGIFMQEIRVGLRTGDTSTKERVKMSKDSPNILVTTPETIAIILNSPTFLEKFKLLEFVIIDEIHSLAENKRGVHLSLSLERLQELSVLPLTRIGLSATVAPLKKIAHFLVGNGRNCLIGAVKTTKRIELETLSPIKNILDLTSQGLNQELYDLLNNLIQKNKTTLIFTNTRAATERVVHKLKEKFPKNYVENIGAHHSSLSKEHRIDIEKRLREGKLKVVVCSTSLELGIDIGFIDLVVLLGSPKSVSRAIQRVGRAGHQLHAIARGKFIVSDFDDMVECCIIMKNSHENIIDEVHIPENCLDVLSQHLFGMCINRSYNINEAFLLIKKSFCYKNLTREDFLSVISYLSGEYEVEVRNLYPKIWYDKETNSIGKRGKLARVIYFTNIGTIPDEGFVLVSDKEGGVIGKIDEFFLEKIKKGDVFVLGGKIYQFLYVRGMKAVVMPSSKSPTIPSWFSEVLPLSFTTALEIQKFRRKICEKFERNVPEKEILEFLKEYCYTNEEIATTLFNYLKRQWKYSKIPHERRVLIEVYRSDKTYVLFHGVFGRRVNEALSRALAYIVASVRKRDIEIGVGDNGFFICGKELNVENIEKGFRKIESKELRRILEESIEKSEIFKRRFRHCAARSLMILRNYKGNTKSVGKQQMSSHFLFNAVIKKSKEFPIIKETKREILEDYMDLENSEMIVEMMNKGLIRIEMIESKLPSPFAINLILQSHSDIIKIEDKIDFIKRVYKEMDRNEKL